MTQRHLDFVYRQGLLDALHDNVSSPRVFAALHGDEEGTAYLQGVRIGLALLFD